MTPWQQLLWLFALATLPAALCTGKETQLQLGKALNVFSRYGYLSISMKVVPRNESDSRWLFREPTIDVFKQISPYILELSDENAGRSQIFQGDFHMEFCDNLRQLLQAYFRDFNFENLDRPWRAFSGSWSKNNMAKNLGISSSYISGNHCYVLVRVSRHRVTGKMRPVDASVQIDEDALKGVDSVVLGDEASVYHFVRNYGSHYITSFTTGNALYQVFVFNPPVYERIKERLKSKGIGELTSNELNGYFSPWYTEHIGDIQSASGNQTTQNWATKNLRSHFYFFTYPTLLNLHGETEQLRKLNDILGNEAILALEMQTLSPVFKEPEKKSWFLECLDNYLKLWESNM